ncbi:MAG: polyphosphate kinase 2 family protein [Thermoanaerobaculia bacterium]
MKTNVHRIEPGSKVRIGDLDPEVTLLCDDKADGKAKSAELQLRLGELQELLFAEHRRKVLIILQGMDTSGKDGTVRHVMSATSPAGVRVVSFKTPTAEELDHDFLWRVHAKTPGNGEIAVFNRSHYEDVLVVRVHELVDEKVWRKRYDQINAFEKTLAASGTLILKFFLHISKSEQRKRLQERIDDPKKHWKFQHGDIEERKLWDDYMAAYDDVLERTSTKHAPWYAIPSDAKWYRNLVISAVIVDALESLGMEYPKVDLSAEVVE